MTFNFARNKMIEISRKRVEEKRAIKKMWAKNGGFSKTQDALKERYKRDIDAGSLPF